ncbi:MAG: hypothetical protein ACKKL5_00440 [Candidatus Komeilibacteria bacterium]
MHKAGFVSTTILLIIFIVIVAVIGGFIYLDSTGQLSFGSGNNDNIDNQAVPDNDPEAGSDQPQINFIPYQSTDNLFTLQIPENWSGEERNGAILFYSYDIAQVQPEQRIKVEITRQANPDLLTATEWLSEKNVEVTNAEQQPATFGQVQGVALIQDNTDTNPGDLNVTMYIPVNEEMIVVNANSYGQIRDAAVQYYNAIFNSWQWHDDITSPSLISADAGAEDAALTEENVPADAIEDANTVNDNDDVVADDSGDINDSQPDVNTDEAVDNSVDDTAMPDDQPLP